MQLEKGGATMSNRRIIGFESWSFVGQDEREALQELESLSVRAAGIVATTLLENSLQSILKAHLIGSDPALLKEIFGETGVLGTFASKIQMAYALGLISATGRADLDIIRKVRNAFAHRLSHSTFENDSVKDRCLNLKLVDQVVSFHDGWGPDSVDGKPRIGTPSFIFPGADPIVLKDARSRFFLSINHFISAMRLRAIPGTCRSCVF